MPTPAPAASLPDAVAAVAEQLHQWRAAHPRATLREIEMETDRRLARVRAELVVSVAQAGETEARPACPDCARPMRRVGVRRRTVATAQEAQLRLQGGRYRCSACGAELFPPG